LHFTQLPNGSSKTASPRIVRAPAGPDIPPFPTPRRGTVRRAARSGGNAKALAHLGKFLYYAGRLEDAERAFTRAFELSASGERDLAVPVLAAYVYASRGERDRIDPGVLSQQPSDVIDGDEAYWVGGVHALLGEREEALAWLRRAVELGNHNAPWIARDRSYQQLREDAEYERIVADVRQRSARYRRLFG